MKKGLGHLSGLLDIGAKYVIAISMRFGKMKHISIEEAKEHWTHHVLDMVTMVKRRKCPICGSNVILVSGDAQMGVYCEGCHEMSIMMIFIGEDIDKTNFLMMADQNGCREV
jgi:ribosomal protein S27AE